MNTLDSERFTLTYDNRTKAKFLYWMGWRVSSISEYIGEKEQTVHSWKKEMIGKKMPQKV